MSKELSRVVTVRVDSPLLEQMRKHAAEDRQSVSDWIRDAIRWENWRRTAAEQPHPDLGRVVGWSCPHLTITSMPGILGTPATSYCGCTMTPLYEHVNYPMAA